MKLNQIVPMPLLNEVFDKGHDWQWTNKGDFEWVAKFTPKGGTEIIVDLAPTEKDGTEIEVNFITKGMGNLKTGAGDEFAVFGTVIDIISHYIKERKPEPTVIQFIARREGEAATDASIENNRAKLYKRIVTRFASKFNYTASWKDIGRITEFYLVRNDVSESGVGRITKQNATKDAPIGSEYQNVDKLFPDHKLDEDPTMDIPAPHETLGVQRKDMPQVAKADFDEYKSYLKDAGVTLTTGTSDPSVLKATQGEFSVAGVKKALGKTLRSINGGKALKPIIVSSDNYVIDGHHRWIVAKHLDRSIPVLRANCDVEQLLQLTIDFPKTTFKDIYEDAIDEQTLATVLRK